MSLINDQIKQLMSLSKDPEVKDYSTNYLSKVFRNAANTIKELSEKLQVANLERSSVYYNGGWIPVDERLPDNSDYVLVTLKSTAYGSNYRQYGVARYIKFENAGCHWCTENYGYLEWDEYSDGKGRNYLYKVVAWCPLPPMYEEKTDD